MLNMKKVFSVLLLTAFTLAVLPSHAQDAKAKSILDKVSTKMKSAKTLKANFSLAMKNAKGATMQTISGTFMMKGVKYHINAGAQEIICDGKSVWTYLKKNNEVQISSFDPSEQTISPSKLFSGSYEKEYNYAYKGSKSFGGKNVDIIQLTPKAAKSFKNVELYVDNSGNIAGGNVYESNGGSYTYTISGITPNASIADAQFTFNTKSHQGVDVTDLR